MQRVDLGACGAALGYRTRLRFVPHRQQQPSGQRCLNFGIHRRQRNDSLPRHTRPHRRSGRLWILDQCRAVRSSGAHLCGRRVFGAVRNGDDRGNRLLWVSVLQRSHQRTGCQRPLRSTLLCNCPRRPNFDAHTTLKSASIFGRVQRETRLGSLTAGEVGTLGDTLVQMGAGISGINATNLQ